METARELVEQDVSVLGPPMMVLALSSALKPSRAVHQAMWQLLTRGDLILQTKGPHAATWVARTPWPL